MVHVLLSQLRDLSDEELNTLALAVGTEQARRASAVVVGTEPAVEPEVAEVPEPVFVTPYGRCWHRRRDCAHLRRSRAVREVPHPWKFDAAVANRRVRQDCCRSGDLERPSA